MNSGRFTWLLGLMLGLTLGVVVATAGQLMAFDLCEANESDRSISVSDDSVVATHWTAADDTVQAPAHRPRFDSLPPSERLVVTDVFRPPNRSAS